MKIDLSKVKLEADFGFISNIMNTYLMDKKKIKNTKFALENGIKVEYTKEGIEIFNSEKTLDINDLSIYDKEELLRKLNVTEIVKKTLEEIVDKKIEIQIENLKSSWESLFFDSAQYADEEILKEQYKNVLLNELTGGKTSKRTLYILKYLNFEDSQTIEKISKHLIKGVTYKKLSNGNYNIQIVDTFFILPVNDHDLNLFGFDFEYRDIMRLQSLGILSTTVQTPLPQEVCPIVCSNKLIELKGKKSETIITPQGTKTTGVINMINLTREGKDILNIISDLTNVSDLKEDKPLEKYLMNIQGIEVKGITKFEKQK